MDSSSFRRYTDWQRRTVLGGYLGYAELWAQQPEHPARAAVARVMTETLVGRLGLSVGADYLLIRTLIPDVLHAGGGVEYHAERVIDALDESQREYDRYVKEHADSGWRSDVEAYWGIPTSVAWDYPDLLTWLRAVEERIDRRTNRPGNRVGLLHAIGENELREDVARLFALFKDRVGDERLLANFGLHAAKVPDPNTPMGLIVEGNRVVVRIPDPPVAPIHVFDQFTYHENRDMRTFTIDALAATEAFMDGLLDAFDRAVARIRLARGERDLI